MVIVKTPETNSISTIPSDGNIRDFSSPVSRSEPKSPPVPTKRQQEALKNFQHGPRRPLGR